MVLSDNNARHRCTATLNTVAAGLAETENAREGGLRAGLVPAAAWEARTRRGSA
jgi:hypothetical protein